MDEKLIKKLTEKIKEEKFEFIKTCGRAGDCPDCKGIVTFNSFYNKFQCVNPDCDFEADANGVRLTQKKEKSKEKEQTNMRKYFGVENIK